MKQLLCILFAGVAAASAQQAGNVTHLYVSKQTGEVSSYNGSYSKNTDRYETGVVNLNSQGPIVHEINPGDLSIGTNQSKTWTGKVYPNVATSPAPGTSIDAQLSGNYTVTYSRPQGAGSSGTVTGTYNGAGGVHELVQETGTKTLAFKVHSLNVTAPDNKTTCLGKGFALAAEGYPGGGTYTWTPGPNVQITNGANADVVDFKSTGLGNSTLTVTYRVANVSYSKTVQINCVAASVSLNVPDQMDVSIDQQISITPTLTPTGTVFWSASNGLTLTSGPYNFVAFVKVLPDGPAIRTVTLKATICNEVIIRTVTLKVNPCVVNAPEKVVVLKNVNADITAVGNMQGTYAWTPGPNIQIVAGANSETVTIKGTETGESWAKVTFTGQNGCTATKKVLVEVLAKPRLTVNVAYAPMNTMCKNERRILSAVAEPSGGNYQWTLGGSALTWYGPAGNTPNVVIEASQGGNASVTCAYTYAGQTVSDAKNTTVKAYSSVVVTGGSGNIVDAGTAVTYTAKAYDHTGALAANPPFHWKVVYIPVGQDANVGNWVSYDLQGTGNTQTVTWTFPQGNYPLPGNPPYLMKAWVEAAEYCTYRSGSVHLQVRSNGN